jgi:hypothetical protein
MQRPMSIILLGLIIGGIMAIGLYIATYLGVTPLGSAINNFFTMVGVIIFIISLFFFLSYETLTKK